MVNVRWKQPGEGKFFHSCPSRVLQGAVFPCNSSREVPWTNHASLGLLVKQCQMVWCLTLHCFFLCLTSLLPLSSLPWMSFSQIKYENFILASTSAFFPCYFSIRMEVNVLLPSLTLTIFFKMNWNKQCAQWCDWFTFWYKCLVTLWTSNKQFVNWLTVCGLPFEKHCFRGLRLRHTHTVGWDDPNVLYLAKLAKQK